MLPDQVDCVLLGTSLTNSIVAAACSRIGQTVLHIDRNGFYGNQWASFTFEQLIEWFKSNDPQNSSLTTIPAELLDKSRMFCIDLTPRFAFSNGSMVDLLVESNVSRYHDFKNNIRILSMIDDKIQLMPCSRSDVFNSNLLTNLVDKRRLMRFIEACVKNNFTQENDGDKPIELYLNEIGLPETLRKFVINSIAMVEPNEKTKEAAERVKNFVMATERYGVSPFLFPLYGCGEYPQSFCRLSAVFGGTYCLNTEIIGIDNISDKFRIKLPDVEVESSHLILDHQFIDKFNQIDKSASQNSYIARAILITKQSILANDDNLLSFMRIPAGPQNSSPINVMELNSTVLVCPQGYNIVYLWTEADQNKDVESQFSPWIQSLTPNDFDSKIVWKIFFKQPNGSMKVDIDGLFVTSPPRVDDIDYDYAINEARQIFHGINPDKEFLPRAPDYNEIITG